MSKPAPTAQPSAFPRIFGRGKEVRIAPVRFQGRSFKLFSDIYYYLLALHWAHLTGLFALVFLTMNAAFGEVYALEGGVSGARPHAFWDGFFFSVQTLGTIGYGQMAPVSFLAHLTVTFEVMLGMICVAMVTGLVFAKFSRPKARVVFSDVAVIALRNKKPTLMFRVGNERANHVVEANMRVTIVRTDVTEEGERLRKLEDLQMVRGQSPAFILTWTALHIIDEKSPLFGMTPEKLRDESVEILVTLTGIDATLGQTIYARFSYIPTEVRFAHRFVDVIKFSGTERLVDYSRFHDTEPLGEQAERDVVAAIQRRAVA